MKTIMNLLLLAGILTIFGGKGAAVEAETSLQALINATPEGGTLTLKAGTYEEPLILKKPITLIGEKGTFIKACSDQPAITITGKNVTLKGISVIGCRQIPAAVTVNGRNHHLKDLVINSASIGIKLESAVNSSFKNIEISGQGIENGIELWESHQNAFETITIVRVQDGFYLENSHNNTLLGNHIKESRYGIHVMFSDHATIKKNTSTRNVTGAMVMETSGSTIENNKFYGNNESVNAQGMLLFDVHDSTIRDNLISENRVGLFIENSTANEITSNKITANFVGAQIMKTAENAIEDNAFIGNVNHFQAIGGMGGGTNQIRHNYWDSALKLDTDGDGKSNLPYQADPYFLTLIKETPEYQLFFQHPGLILLQKMLKSPAGMVVTDVAPQMEQSTHEPLESQPSDLTGALSFVMISTSLLIIFFGRKQL
ncbi:nitrous oxide reductase family maturation protein NosD [Bacillus sp. FJAT-29814]|uniref:right-handed parallel beta-helix repeat-containing protein n=1 Tax=Bacillus sp. FJAT-29814 TaxID=1729688 RepID=UPI0008313BC7|nr:NosD domain-containing protein [Bacillus sp. FJAT-29814]